MKDRNKRSNVPMLEMSDYGFDRNKDLDALEKSLNPKNELQTLCEDIRIRRLTAKLTQVQLSELTGIRQDRISQIENGRKYLKVIELFEIARVLGPFEIKAGE